MKNLLRTQKKILLFWDKRRIKVVSINKVEFIISHSIRNLKFI